MPRRQPRNPGSTKRPCLFYLNHEWYEDVLAKAGEVSFSAYVASAVLERLVADGAVIYGDVLGGACDRAHPSRDPRCETDLPALWWNKNGHVFFCETCAKALNSYMPGTCVRAPIPTKKAECGAPTASTPTPFDDAPREGSLFQRFPKP